MADRRRDRAAPVGGRLELVVRVDLLVPQRLLHVALGLVVGVFRRQDQTDRADLADHQRRHAERDRHRRGHDDQREQDGVTALAPELHCLVTLRKLSPKLAS